ncbi:unannotated protein [freshwater metagenome]|uniref:Unannotated protein n=1 Tax=freshwater metagenome TaxID=449393 RepID=A0A6J7S8Z3_9ZZZZ
MTTRPAVERISASEAERSLMSATTTVFASTGRFASTARTPVTALGTPPFALAKTITLLAAAIFMSDKILGFEGSRERVTIFVCFNFPTRDSSSSFIVSIGTGATMIATPGLFSFATSSCCKIE